MKLKISKLGWKKFTLITVFFLAFVLIGFSASSAKQKDKDKAAQVPKISFLSPDSGPVGTEVTIKGSLFEFGDNTYVKMYFFQLVLEHTQFL